MRISVAWKVGPDGEVTVLYAGDDAAKARAAYRDSEGPGKVFSIGNVRCELSKHYAAPAPAVKTADPVPEKTSGKSKKG